MTFGLEVSDLHVFGLEAVADFAAVDVSGLFVMIEVVAYLEQVLRILSPHLIWALLSQFFH